jgi:hypothetical protein
LSEERSVAWIDYIIASDDPADKALADEFIARNWSHAETMRWVMRETEAGRLTSEAMAKLEAETRLSQDLQERICHRGQELMASGATPAEAALAQAWHAHWRRLAIGPSSA